MLEIKIQAPTPTHWLIFSHGWKQRLLGLGRVHRQQVQVGPRAGSQQRAHGLQLPEGRRDDERRATRARARVSGRAPRQEQSDDVGGALARGDLCGRTPSSR